MGAFISNTIKQRLVRKGKKLNSVTINISDLTKAVTIEFAYKCSHYLAAAAVTNIGMVFL